MSSQSYPSLLGAQCEETAAQTELRNFTESLQEGPYALQATQPGLEQPRLQAPRQQGKLALASSHLQLINHQEDGGPSPHLGRGGAWQRGRVRECIHSIPICEDEYPTVLRHLPRPSASLSPGGKHPTFLARPS